MDKDILQNQGQKKKAKEREKPSEEEP